MILRLWTTLLAACVTAALLAGQAVAAGGDYVVYGGTPNERAQVSAALDASAFDWDIVPARIAIRITSDPETYAVPGEICIDGRLLDTGRFAWAIVQHEYAHQVDFFLLNDTIRARLNTLLGGVDWYGFGSPHHLRGVERFASTLAWAYWPSSQSALRPEAKTDEAGGMRPARFRSLMATLVGTAPVPTDFFRRAAFSFAPQRLRTLAFPGASQF